MNTFSAHVPAGLKYGPPSQGTRWSPHVAVGQQLLISESMISAFGNWVPVKIFKGRGEKKKKAEKEMPSARLPHCGLESRLSVERVWKKNDFGRGSSTAAIGTSRNAARASPGLFPLPLLQQTRPGCLADWGYDEFPQLSSAIPSQPSDGAGCCENLHLHRKGNSQNVSVFSSA